MSRSLIRLICVGFGFFAHPGAFQLQAQENPGFAPNVVDEGVGSDSFAEESAGDVFPEESDEDSLFDFGRGDALETGGGLGDRTGDEEGGDLRGLMEILSSSEEGGEEGDANPAEKIREEQERQINELRREARSNIEKGRVDAAIVTLNELISIKPYDPDYHWAISFCYRNKSLFDKALKKYSDVLDLGGDKALAALMKAEALIHQGERELCFESLREAALLGRNIINDMRTLKPLNQFENDTEFIKLALSLEQVQVDIKRIKDPFTNPFPFREGEGEEGEGVAEIRLSTPEEQELLLKEASKTLDRVKFYIKLEDEDKAMRAYLDLKGMLDQSDQLTIPKIVTEFSQIAAKMPDVEVEIEGIRLKYYYRQAQEKLRQVKEIFQDGEYDRVAHMHGEIVNFTEEMIQANEDYAEVANRILEVSEIWFERASVRQEFEAMRPSIQGIVISDDGRLAVLNDTVVKQGEFLDDIRVMDIESNRVTFRYKGEDIPVVFRRY